MKLSKDVFSSYEEKRSSISVDGKKKRPDVQLYVAPALRFSCNESFEDRMAHTRDMYTSEVENREVYSLENSDSTSKRSANRDPMRVRYESSSSSSKPRSVSDASGKDDDSSDLEECCSLPVEAMSDEQISMKTIENKPNSHWNKEGRKQETNNHDIENENYWTNTRKPNRTVTLHDHSDEKSQANRSPNSDSNESDRDRGLFFNDGENNLSDIEALIDTYTKEGRVYTSTPNSDIVEPKVLGAARYSPEESRIESTLLGGSAIHEMTVNTNRNERDYNFDIYQDPSSVKSQPTDFSEIFGNNYIPPPVPPPLHISLLPPIHRLPSPVSSSTGCSVIRHPSPKPVLRHPRPVFSPSPQIGASLASDSSLVSPNSLYKLLVPRYGLPPRSQSASSLAPNLSRMPSSQQPILLSQERFYRPRSPETEPNSNAPYLPPQRNGPQTQEEHKADDSFYIPPPVPPPQRMLGSQHIRNINQRQNYPNYQTYTNSLANKIKFDATVSTQDLNTKR